nr:hypothetical protein [Tanacetum cinerariifolium]
MVRCACGLEAVIRTSWANRNPDRHFYGCPTLSPTCVNFLRLYNSPMCQRSVQIIPRFVHLEEFMQTQKEAQQAIKLSNLTRQRQLPASVNYRREIIEELERLLGNLVACKTMEHFKHIQKAVFVEVIDLKKELRLQIPS